MILGQSSLNAHTTSWPFPVRLFIALRVLVLLTLLAVINYFAGLDLSLLTTTLIVVASICLGTYLTYKHFRLRGLVCLAAILVLGIWLLFQMVYLLPLGSEYLFAMYGWQQWFQIILLVFFLGVFSTWIFWRYRSAGAAEVLLIGATLLAVFAGHRNYRFDSSKLLNQIAWLLQWHPLLTLVSLGLGFGLFASGYLFVSTLAQKTGPNPQNRGAAARAELHSKENLVWSLASGVILAILFSIVTWIIYQQQTIEIKARLQMGVSDETTEGLSPLTFQSALGASSQPAAIVRLENDYANNPFTPMLYLREAALSKFDGKEMVLATGDRDADVPNAPPGEKFSSEGFPDQVERTPITQSIYLLADHRRTFAIDYPLSLVGLTLPANTNKFKRAYRAYSMAPTFDKQELENAQLGEPDWTTEQWQHYTEAHPDPRYNLLARKIVGTVSNPVAQARLLIDYLNLNAIYTLTPGHTVPKGEDQTAPFLFGDMRGYCVHFAHAMVYMLRSLGIPARIGTGYLTDLSQSKDGHILLRMSDRHAWAEIYLSGKGWVPFDIEPQQVEVHAESPVDLNLLEELMDLLGSSEEILPDDILSDENSEKESGLANLLQPRYLYFIIASLLVLVYLVKAYLLFGYRLPGTPRQTARRALLAVRTSLADHGNTRLRAETLREFVNRMVVAGNLASAKFIDSLLAIKYAPSKPEYSSSMIQALTTQSLSATKKREWWRRIIGFFNLLSIGRV